MAQGNLISVLGLFTLLGIAWLLSYHRSRIPIRTVLWGVGLQFLFALIILREDNWSFVGMVVFAALLGSYMLTRSSAPDQARETQIEGRPQIEDSSREEKPVDFGRLPRRFWLAISGVLVASAAIARFVDSPVLWRIYWILAITLLTGVLYSILNDRWRRALIGLICIGGAAWGVAWWLPQAMLPLLVAAVAFLFVNSRWKLAPGAQPWIGTLLIAVGTAALIASGTTGQQIFGVMSEKIAFFLSLSDYGARFLFANLIEPENAAAGAAWPGFGFQFAFRVLPTIIFFGGFMAVLYYLGIIQKVIVSLARFMRWTMGTSGAETLSCSANIFVGQTEAPLLIKPFLQGMTRSELLTVMVGGFATIAGGVLAAYIGMGVPANHLIAASVMSAPAALVLGKILYPETEHSETAGDTELPEIEVGGNVIEAATNGITDGFKLALNVGAMLVGFIALIAVVDVFLGWADGWIDGRWLGGQYVDYASIQTMSPAKGEFQGWFPGSLQTLFGTLLAPLAWLMGVPWADAPAVGNLLGVKLSLNELVAFGTLSSYIKAGVLSDRGTVIAVYALTGFANFSSIGIQIGGISALVPERRADLAKVGLKAMFGGAIASWTTATIAGILL